MQRYQSKKDKNIIARLDSKDEKYGTVILVYETGDEVGKSISITQSTLKRWWRAYLGETEEVKTEPKSIEETLNLDMEKINTPYPEPTHQEYIPKPKSVIEYEEKKHKSRKNNDIPEFSDIVEFFANKCAKINERSLYVKFNDGSTLWRKQGAIDMYVTEEMWIKLTEKGLTSSANKDKARPFHFVIKTSEEFELVKSVILEEDK